MKIKWLETGRKAKGYTMCQMAKEMNMSMGGYTKLENGTNKLTLARFIQICKVLDLDAAATLKEVTDNDVF